jgi:EAL domain-containing protein (putative c-di-GMP-specific phosphodiesterase class I)
MDWRKAGLPPVKVAVNVSPMQIYFGDFVEEVRSAIAESPLAAGALEIELTESTIMRNSDESSLQIQKLRELGINVSIDDFGTGYSSLNYLQSLPVDQLKIDRSFLQKVPLASATAVVRAITALAHSLGLSVVAEGIEREDQIEPLRAMGVDLIQGYLISRPMPAEQATFFLRSFSSRAA